MTTSDQAPNTRETILQVARAAVQARGYNALSFRELAKEIGVKSASVHYHFPTKGDLAAALAGRYADEAGTFLEQLFQSKKDHAQLMTNYIALFRAALKQDNRMCLCGIMAAETSDLPPEARREVERFTSVNTAWLFKVLSRRHPKLRPEALKSRAIAIFAAIEGAQLVARGNADVKVFDQAVAAYQAVGLFS